MFNKELYWKRRKNNVRGQTDLVPEPRQALWTEEDVEAKKCSKDEVGKGRISKVFMRMVKGKGLTAFPRYMARRKIVDRKLTNGETNPAYTSRSPIKLPTKDPSKTNHKRMLEREAARDGRRFLNS